MSDVLIANLRASAESDALRSRLAQKEPFSFTIVAENRELMPTAGKLTRSLDTVADIWTATIPWTPKADAELDKILQYRAYPKSRVYLGKTLCNTGRIYSVENELTDTGRVKNVEGASLTADLVDSSISSDAMLQGYNQSAFTWKGLSVWNYCNAILPPLGLGVKTDLNDAGAFYTKPYQIIETKFTETYAEVITRIAFQRGMLVTNDEYGNLFLTRPKQKQPPVGTLTEGDKNVLSWKLKINGRELWYNYITYSQDGLGAMYLDSESDPSVKDTVRALSIVASLTDFGGIKATARFKRNQQIVKALTFDIPVIGWYAPNGSLWSPNTLVHVVSDTLEIPDGFTFLIKAADYDFSAAGCTSTLHLIPPDAYGLDNQPVYFGLWQA
jgi:prophage tail gpP-like protein